MTSTHKHGSHQLIYIKYLKNILKIKSILLNQKVVVKEKEYY